MIEGLGPRGPVDLSLGRSVVLHCDSLSLGLPGFFKDDSYNSRIFVTSVSFHAALNVAGFM